jgi:CHAD domain-containing protein
MKRELPAELARHLADWLKRTRRRYRKRLASAQRHFSEPAVHDLRVETRRALALLDLLMALRLPAASPKARRTLKRRLDAFDELRDTQVELKLVAPWLEQHPEAAAFERHLRRREAGLRAELRRQIRKLKPHRIERLLKALAQEVADTETGKGPAVEFLRGPLERAYTRVMNLRQRIRPPDTKMIHRTRVAFKKLRYLCELLQPLLPGLTARRLRRMHAWQTRMGDIQDTEVLLAEIERAVKHGHVPLAAVKPLHAALARRLVRLVKRFVSTADELESFRPRLG